LFSCDSLAFNTRYKSPSVTDTVAKWRMSHFINCHAPNMDREKVGETLRAAPPKCRGLNQEIAKLKMEFLQTRPE